MVVHYPPIEVSSETLTLLSLSHELLTISLKTAVCVLKAFWGLVVFPIMNWTHFKMKINTVSDKCFIMMWLYLLNKHNRLSDYTTLQTACYNVLQLVILSHQSSKLHHACSSREPTGPAVFCWLYPSHSCFSLVSLTSNLDRSYSGFMICWDRHKHPGVWLSSELDF